MLQGTNIFMPESLLTHPELFSVLSQQLQQLFIQQLNLKVKKSDIQKVIQTPKQMLLSLIQWLNYVPRKYLNHSEGVDDDLYSQQDKKF